MKISRYYVNKTTLEEDQLVKDKDFINRLLSVMHYKAGQKIILFNGLDSNNYTFEIKDISKKEITLNFIEKNEVFIEVTKKVNVYISLFKTDFDEAVREMVEIGVNKLIPIISERTERKELNTRRLNKIIIESCEQSGRLDIPVLENIIKLKDFKNVDTKNINICYHTEEVSQENYSENISQDNLNTKNKGVDNNVGTNIFIGPEGGWTSGEIDWFKENGFYIRHLRTNILRAKTAAAICLFDAVHNLSSV